MKAEEPDKPWNRNTKVTAVGEKLTDSSGAFGRRLLQHEQESEQDYIFFLDSSRNIPLLPVLNFCWLPYASTSIYSVVHRDG